MTTKSEAAAAERKAMDRYEARLAKAFTEYAGDKWRDGVLSGRVSDASVLVGMEFGVLLAKTQLRILRASAAALYPGDQKRKHLLPALGKMVTAACRVIRRGGK